MLDFLQPMIQVFGPTILKFHQCLNYHNTGSETTLNVKCGDEILKLWVSMPMIWVNHAYFPKFP